VAVVSVGLAALVVLAALEAVYLEELTAELVVAREKDLESESALGLASAEMAALAALAALAVLEPAATASAAMSLVL